MHTVTSHIGWLVVAALAGACGGMPVPQDQLTAAQASVKGAEVAGAPNNPKAALHLKLATEEVETAKKLIADGKNEEARREVDRAQADADLALALAEEAKAQGETAQTKEQFETLKKKAKQ